ncbi:MAG: hypothetical protein ACJ0UT_10815 [Candidatus Latescibacterota bacterium]
MEDQIRSRIQELIAQRDQIVSQINQNTTQRQQLETAYQQTAGAIGGLYEFAPDAEVEINREVEAPAENGQSDLELVDA